MQKADVYNFAYSKGIYLSDREVDIVYNYIKNNYMAFFSGKITYDDILLDAKKYLSSENYDKFLIFYNQFKGKI